MSKHRNKFREDDGNYQKLLNVWETAKKKKCSLSLYILFICLPVIIHVEILNSNSNNNSQIPENTY